MLVSVRVVGDDVVWWPLIHWPSSDCVLILTEAHQSCKVSGKGTWHYWAAQAQQIR